MFQVQNRTYLWVLGQSSCWEENLSEKCVETNIWSTNLKPFFFPINLDLVKSILKTDFPYFHSHGTYQNENVDPLSGNLFNLDGEKWKDIRTKCTPCFTSGKIKTMHKILSSNAEVLKEVLNVSIKDGSVDIKDILTRFTLDNIGDCVFGLKVNCLNNSESKFQVYAEKIFESSFTNMVRQLPILFFPHKILKLFNYSNRPKDVTEYFRDKILYSINYKEENKISRNDFLSMMIEMNMTINEILPQIFIFFTAGFETSSTTIAFASYELAVNQEVQEKLRKEINNIITMHDNELTYEVISKMEYLDRVVRETLRKYPPITTLIRKCTKDYELPGEPWKIIEKDTFVVISVLGIHYDPENYPEPEKFDPKRFTEESKTTRAPTAWIPFGDGPRICIGARFGIYQTKVGIVALLRNYKLKLNKKTRTPLVYTKTMLVPTVEGGIWLDLEKIVP